MKLNYVRNKNSSVDLDLLKTKVDNLGTITVKNNISNQVLPQQKINAVPTQNQHIVRYEDIKFKRIVETSTNIPANTPKDFTPTNFTITGGKLYELIIKIGITNVDYVTGVQLYVNNNNYRNMGPVISFANSELTVDLTMKVWIESSKVWIRANKAIPSLEIFIRQQQV